MTRAPLLAARGAQRGDVGTHGIRVGDARLGFSDRGLGSVSLVVPGADAAGVAASRRHLAALVGRSAGDLVVMEQVHGAGVALVTRADRGRGLTDHADAVPGADALVTHDTGVALAVMVADCVPVLLVAPGLGVAAVHAGRRGTAGGVVGNAVTALTDDPAAVVAVIGPAIGGCCYEVPATLAAGFDGARSTTSWGSPSLDLPATVRDQLAAAGVGRVRTVAGCTRCGTGAWFSHRAAGSGQPAGRQAGVVVRDGASHPPVAGVPNLDLGP